MRDLRKEITALFEDFVSTEEHEGQLSIGEFVYRLTMAGMHEVMSSISDYLEPMGTVMVKDRSNLDAEQDPLFAVEEEEEAMEETDDGNN